MAGQGGTTEKTEPKAGDLIPVPSGQEVRFLDVIHGEPGPEGLTARFRFVAPAIARDGGTVAPEAAQEDMAALCSAFALQRIAKIGPQPVQIIIVLSDREVAFGETVPEATQYFEAYSLADGMCIWEPF
ncbi:MAG: DUF6497 family protein [Proteobacteria bacterium]|nr:DUF6497 family protein [Pseudomonadota bacterium]